MTDEPKRDDPTDFSQFRKPARKLDLTVVDSANESLGYSASPKLSQALEPPLQRRRSGGYSRPAAMFSLTSRRAPKRFAGSLRSPTPTNGPPD